MVAQRSIFDRLEDDEKVILLVIQPSFSFGKIDPMRMTDGANAPREASPDCHFPGEVPVIFTCYPSHGLNTRTFATLQEYCKGLANLL